MIWKIQGLRVLKIPFLAFIAAFLMLCMQVHAQNTIDYLGYRISTSLPKTKNYSVVTVRKGRRTLVMHKDGIAQNYGSSIELLSLLGSGKNQLVISQYTGGAHCCTNYWIYELIPRFRLLFQSKDYETLGQYVFQNIDSDNDLEIVDNTPAFHYFDNLAFVSSPVPTLIFDYNRRTRKFELANRRFNKYLLKDQAGWIARSQAVRESDPSQHRVDSLGILLSFVYAGKENDGWKYYHQERARSKKGVYFNNDATIRRALNAEPAYRSIYHK